MFNRKNMINFYYASNYVWMPIIIEKHAAVGYLPIQKKQKRLRCKCTRWQETGSSQQSETRPRSDVYRKAPRTLRSIERTSLVPSEVSSTRQDNGRFFPKGADKSLRSPHGFLSRRQCIPNPRSKSAEAHLLPSGCPLVDATSPRSPSVNAPQV